MKIILADVFITINDIGKEKRVEIAYHNFSETTKFLLHFEKALTLSTLSVTLDKRTSPKKQICATWEIVILEMSKHFGKKLSLMDYSFSKKDGFNVEVARK